jgi:hypothetical protein
MVRIRIDRVSGDRTTSNSWPAETRVWAGYSTLTQRASMRVAKRRSTRSCASCMLSFQDSLSALPAARAACRKRDRSDDEAMSCQVTLWHEPSHFQFYIRGSIPTPELDSSITADLQRSALAVREGIVVVGVRSEYTLVPITVEFSREGFGPSDPSRWDRVHECALVTPKGGIVFESCTGEPFGHLDVDAGEYRLRVHYGGQAKVRDNGETEDFYLIQVWPTNGEGS